MLRWIAGLLAVIVLAGAYFSFTQYTDLADARGALQATQTRAEARLRVNDMVREYAAQQEATADSAEAEAKEADARALRAEGRLAAATTTRDSLDAALVAKDAYRDAFHSQVVAAGALRARGDSLQAANDDLAGIVRDYGDASQGILDATKPSFLKSLLPDVGFGATVGIDPTTLKPAKAVGVNVHWSF